MGDYLPELDGVMKVIFLDIDGVLNNHNSLRDGVQIVPEKVLLLKNICKSTNARVVISSSWRNMYTLEMLEFALFCAGLGRGRVIDKTRKEYDNLRGNQIQEWIEDNHVEAYVILDDDSAHMSEHSLEVQVPFLQQERFEQFFQMSL